MRRRGVGRGAAHPHRGQPGRRGHPAGLTLRSDETFADPRVHGHAAALGFHSLVASPIRLASTAMGALAVTGVRPGQFSAADVHSLELLTDSLGAALERLATRERLEASEADYRLLFADHPHPMWVFDIQTLAFLAVNRSALRAYGYSEAEFLAMRITDIWPVEDAGRVEDEIDRACPVGWRSGQWRHRRKDGSLLTVQVTSGEIAFGGRRARLVLAEDVTARLRAEREATRATRAQEMLSRCNEALTREDDEARLLHAVCEIAVTVGGFPAACVGYVQDDTTARCSCRGRLARASRLLPPPASRPRPMRRTATAPWPARCGRAARYSSPTWPPTVVRGVPRRSRTAWPPRPRVPAVAGRRADLRRAGAVPARGAATCRAMNCACFAISRRTSRSASCRSAPATTGGGCTTRCWRWPAACRRPATRSSNSSP